MKKYGMIICTALLLTALVGCTQNTEGEKSMDASISTPALAEYKKITPAEAKEMMVEGVVILDVRSADEFAAGHIEGAMVLPDVDIQALAGEKLPDMDATILVYCRSGVRSAKASNALIEMGYQNVYDFGGIQDWPYDIVT